MPTYKSLTNEQPFHLQNVWRNNISHLPLKLLALFPITQSFISVLSITPPLWTTMGNCFALHQLTKRKSCSQSTTTRHEDVLRVMKTNGEILDYTRSIFIKGYGNNDHHCFPIWNLGRPFRVSGDHSPTLVSMDNTSGSKRVKMILTKQQLQELLSKKKIAVEEICFLGMQSVALCGVNSSSRWQPGLETILEESE